MNLSSEYERGRAGEHLVVADLILQGVPAVMIGGAWPYDILAAFAGRQLRVQVKSTTASRSRERARNVYRFSLRCARGSTRRISVADADVIAFVALDVRRIAYFTIAEMMSRTGAMKQTVDLRDSETHIGRVYPGGKRRVLAWHQTFNGHRYFSRLWASEAEAQS